MVVYSQNDPAWKDTKIGFDTGPYDTIGNYGCCMTAIANVCSWAGNDLNPAQINDICKDRGWLVSSDLVSRDDVPSQLCSNLQFEGRTNWHTATPMNFFADASDPNVAYIICIDASHAPGIQTHFVMVWATNGPNDLVIDDSWDGQRKSLTHYGTPSVIIQSATKFRKIPPAPAPTPPPVVVATPAPAPPPPTPYVPPAAPVKGTPAEKYQLLTTVMWFGNASDATFHQNPKSTLDAGSYFVIGKQDKSYNLSNDNMKDLGQWVNTDDNVAPKPAEPEAKPAPVTTDIASLFQPFPDGKSRRYIAQQDMYLYDLAARDAKGININKGEPVPIFGTVTRDLIYLIPKLGSDSVPGQIAPKEHYYGIPTTSVYTGLPAMKSQQYIDALAQAEAEHREYRRSKGHETTEDKLYYAQQMIARAVKDGIRFLDVISLKKLSAVLGKKDKK